MNWGVYTNRKPMNRTAEAEWSKYVDKVNDRLRKVNMTQEIRRSLSHPKISTRKQRAEELRSEEAKAELEWYKEFRDMATDHRKQKAEWQRKMDKEERQEEEKKRQDEAIPEEEGKEEEEEKEEKKESKSPTLSDTPRSKPYSPRFPKIEDPTKVRKKRFTPWRGNPSHFMLHEDLQNRKDRHRHSQLTDMDRENSRIMHKLVTTKPAVGSVRDDVEEIKHLKSLYFLSKADDGDFYIEQAKKIGRNLKKKDPAAFDSLFPPARKPDLVPLRQRVKAPTTSYWR